MKKTIILLFILQFYLLNKGQAQQYYTETGFPYIKNYTHKEYSGHPQNFCITQDKRGVLYFGNFMGIIEFDGKRWKTIPKKETSKINAIAIDKQGRIFIGALGEIGMLQPEIRTGKLVFKNLTDSIPLNERKDLNIHTVLSTKNGILFFSHKTIYIWNYVKLQKIWSTQSDIILSAFYHDNSVYIMMKNAGLSVFTNNELTPIETRYRLLDACSIIAYTSDTLLVCTANQGLWYINKNKLDSFHFEANTYIKKYNATCAIKLHNGYYAIGTERGGIVIMSSAGKIIQIVNQFAGLYNDNVKSLYQDKNHILWVALNNGISKIDVTLALTYFNENTGLPGEINGIFRSKNNLYFYGTKGIYYWSKYGFQLVKNISSACWSIIEANNIILAATSKGVFSIQNNEARQITNNFSLSILHSIKYPDRVYIGEFENLAILEYNGTWNSKGELKRISKEIRKIIEDNDGMIWLEIPSSEICRFNPETNSINYYSKESGLPDFILYYINKTSKDIYFSTSSGLFTFDKSSNKFTKKILTTDSSNYTIHKLTEDHYGNLYVTNWDETNVLMLQKKSDNTYKKYIKPFKPINDFVVWYIYPEKDGIVWFSGPDGVIRYDSKIVSKSSEFITLIRSVKLPSDSVIFNGTFFDSLYTSHTIQNEQFKYVINYDLHTIQFDFAATDFNLKDVIYFQYYLEGYDKYWSSWTTESKKEYSLPDGKYKLFVKAKNVYNEETEESVFEFEIQTPIGRRWYAYVLYGILAALALFFYIRNRMQTLHRKNQDLQSIIKDRTEEIISQKDEIEKQSLELASKNNELEKINTMVQSINAEIHFSNLLQTLLEKLKVVKGLETGYILLRQENSGNFKFAAIYGGDITEIQNTDLSIEDIHSTFLTDSNEVFEDIFHTTSFPAFENSQINDKILKPKSALIITVNFNNITEGFIIMTNRGKENAFDKRDFSLAKNLKEHLISAFIKTKILEDLELFNEQLTQQNNIITKQKEDITASIQYASRIQAAVLPPKSVLLSMFSEFFILFQPRDIVSGDFYWMHAIDNKMFAAAADCTGHGVPGAFMSLLGMSFLKEIVISKKINQANEILNELRHHIKQALRQTGKELETKDGMDIALCIIDNQKMKIQYAGAYNSLYLVRKTDENAEKGELIEYKADKMPVGIYINEKESFTNHEIDILKNDMVYMFSDGYCDQFGKNGRKFMSKNFKELLTKIYDKPTLEQREILFNTINDWRGNHEQVDDMLVMGIRM